MIKRILQLLTLAALVNLIYQYSPRGEADELIPVMNTEGLWGYVDGGGRVRIDFQWDEVETFDGKDMARVLKGGLYGLIDRKGKSMIPTFWRGLTVIEKHGIAEVWKNDQVGIVNLSGEVLMRTKWDYLSLSLLDSTDVTIVRNSEERGYVFTDGTFVADPDWLKLTGFGPQGIATVKKADGWWLIDRKGNVLNEDPLVYESIEPFDSSGLARVRLDELDIGIGENGKRSWIDTSGNPKFRELGLWESIWPFDEEGMAVVKRKGKWGWINDRGEIVIEPVWRFVGWGGRADSFQDNGLCRVSDGKSNRGLIDRTGRVVVEPVWEEIGQFDEVGYAKVESREGGMGFINSRGEVVIEPNWFELGDFNENGYAWCRGVDGQERGQGFLDRSGEVMFLTSYKLMQLDKNNRVLYGRGDDIRDKGEFLGWMNEQGEEVIKIPEGWMLAGRDARSGYYHEGCYTIQKEHVVNSGMRYWYNQVKNWISGSTGLEEIVLCRTMDKDGNIIWENSWLRKTTKAWIWFVVAVFALLVTMWMGRKGKARMAIREAE